MNKALTTKQQRLYNYIRERIEAERDPSYRDMAEYMGMASVNSAYVMVQALAKKGWVRVRHGVARGVRIAKGK